MLINIKTYNDASLLIAGIVELSKGLVNSKTVSNFTKPEFSMKLGEIGIDVESYGCYFSYKGIPKSVWIGFYSKIKASHTLSLAVESNSFTIKNKKLAGIHDNGDGWFYLPLFLYCNSSNPIDQSAFDSMISQMITALGI